MKYCSIVAATSPTLALLILDGVIKGFKVDELPFYLADSGYIHGYLLADDGVVETGIIRIALSMKTIYDWGERMKNYLESSP